MPSERKKPLRVKGHVLRGSMSNRGNVYLDARCTCGVKMLFSWQTFRVSQEWHRAHKSERDELRAHLAAEKRGRLIAEELIGEEIGSAKAAWDCMWSQAEQRLIARGEIEAL